MKKIKKSEGLCSFCREKFSGSAMSRHLESCPERKKKIEQEKGNGKVFSYGDN